MKGEYFLEALNYVDDKYIEEARYNTMKKKFNFKPIIAVAACAAIAFAAVPVVNNFVNTTPAVQGTEEVGFTVYESGVHAGETIGTHKIEMRLNRCREAFVDTQKIGTYKTINILGKEWTAIYEGSLSGTDYTVQVDEYTGVSNGRKVSFKINSVTGKCEFFLFNTRLETSDSVLTRDELYEIAYENFLAGGYTDDPENYQLSAEHDIGTMYAFTFSRFVNGIETSEAAQIILRYNGEFSCYMGNNIGEMKDVDASHIEIEKFYDAIETKIKTIYDDNYIGYDRKGVVYTKLANGEYILEYNPYVDVKNKEGDIVKDRCFFTVIINK